MRPRPAVVLLSLPPHYFPPAMATKKLGAAAAVTFAKVSLFVFLIPAAFPGARGLGGTSRVHRHRQEPTGNSSSGIWDAGKPIPIDPVLDYDLPRDDNNPLEAMYDAPFNVTDEEEDAALEAVDAKTKKAKEEAEEKEKKEEEEEAEKEAEGMEEAEKEAEKDADEEEEDKADEDEFEKAEKELEDIGSEEGGNASSTSTGCATRSDTRASSWIAKIAPAGTPCVFGVDPRDEGAHCIESEGKYGSFGWCYTDKSSGAWGSCNEHCPLFGHAKILGKKIDKVAEHLREVKLLLNVSEENVTNATNATNATAEEGGAAEAAGAAAGEEAAGAAAGKEAAAGEAPAAKDAAAAAAPEAEAKEAPPAAFLQTREKERVGVSLKNTLAELTGSSAQLEAEFGDLNAELKENVKAWAERQQLIRKQTSA